MDSRPRIKKDKLDKLVELGYNLEDLIDQKIAEGTNSVPLVKRKLVPSHAVLDPAIVAGLAQETTLQNVLTDTTSLDGKDFATETTLANLEGKDFSTETTLAALNTKIDEETDDDNIANNATNPVMIVKNYQYDADNNKWIREKVPDPDDAPPVDLSLAGDAISSTGSLGALGIGLLTGIGSAAGNLLTITSNGAVKTELITNTNPNNPVQVYPTGSGFEPGADWSLHCVSKSAEMLNSSNNYNFVRHSHYQATTGITATGAGTTIDMTSTPMSQFTMLVKGLDNTGTFTSATVYFEFSLDGVIWVQQAPAYSATTTAVIYTKTAGSMRYLRYNVTAIALVGDASLTLQLLASAR